MSAIFQSVNDHFNSLPVWAKAAIGTAAAAVASVALIRMNKQRASPYKKDFVPGVVYLYQFPRCHFVPNLSCFCLKLETWLRIEDVKYEVVETPWAIRSKEGTLPFVELDGKEYDDSGFIIRDLTQLIDKTEKENNLTYEQKAVARAFEQMIENSTIWSFSKVRYLEKWNDFVKKETLGFNTFYYFNCSLFRWFMQSGFRKRLFYHGIGKHESTEIDGIGTDDIRAVSNYLDVKTFFLGEQAHRIDAALFGVLAQIIYFSAETPHKSFIEKECQNLIKYCDRLKDKFWPDWDEVCGENLVLNSSFMASRK